MPLHPSEAKLSSHGMATLAFQGWPSALQHRVRCLMLLPFLMTSVGPQALHDGILCNCSIQETCNLRIGGQGASLAVMLTNPSPSLVNQGRCQFGDLCFNHRASRLMPKAQVTPCFLQNQEAPCRNHPGHAIHSTDRLPGPMPPTPPRC